MGPRKPQINFQVEPPLKLLYDEAKFHGHLVTRLCAAGLLKMIEDPQARAAALDRLRDWEAEYADAGAEDIRMFVQGAADALQRGARGSRRARPVPAGRRRARRSKSG